MQLIRIPLLLTILAVCATAQAQTLISDNFDDNDITTNTTGVGSGFIGNQGTSAVTESGGFATFTEGGANTQILRSNTTDAFNPFQSTPTTLAISFGSLGFDTDFNRQWFGYQQTGANQNHAYPQFGVQGLYVSILYGNSGEDGNYSNDVAHRGNLVAVNDESAMTTLASWDWVSDPTEGFAFTLTTTDTSYALAFDGATAVNFETGASTGTLTGLGSITTDFDVFVHGQTFAGGEVGFAIDSLSVTAGAIPEPASATMMAGLAALVGASALRRRRNR